MAELSAIKSVDLSTIKAPSSRSPVATKLLSLEVGQGFEIKGVERNELSNLLTSTGKRDRRKFSCKKLGTLHYLIFRRA